MTTTTTRHYLAAAARRLAAALEGSRGRLILLRLRPDVALDPRERRIVADAVAAEADRTIARLLEARRVTAALAARGQPRP